MHSLFLHPVGQKQSFKWKLTDVEDYRVWGSKKKNSEKMTARITAADQGLILHSSDNSNNFQIGPP